MKFLQLLLTFTLFNGLIGYRVTQKSDDDQKRSTRSAALYDSPDILNIEPNDNLVAFAVPGFVSSDHVAVEKRFSSSEVDSSGLESHNYERFGSANKHKPDHLLGDTIKSRDPQIFDQRYSPETKAAFIDDPKTFQTFPDHLRSANDEDDGRITELVNKFAVESRRTSENDERPQISDFQRQRYSFDERMRDEFTNQRHSANLDETQHQFNSQQLMTNARFSDGNMDLRQTPNKFGVRVEACSTCNRNSDSTARQAVQDSHHPTTSNFGSVLNRMENFQAGLRSSEIWETIPGDGSFEQPEPIFFNSLGHFESHSLEPVENHLRGADGDASLENNGELDESRFYFEPVRDDIDIQDHPQREANIHRIKTKLYSKHKLSPIHRKIKQKTIFVGNPVPEYFYQNRESVAPTQNFIPMAPLESQSHLKKQDTNTDLYRDMASTLVDAQRTQPGVPRPQPNVQARSNNREENLLESERKNLRENISESDLRKQQKNMFGEAGAADSQDNEGGEFRSALWVQSPEQEAIAHEEAQEFMANYISGNFAHQPGLDSSEEEGDDDLEAVSRSVEVHKEKIPSQRKENLESLPNQEALNEANTRQALPMRIPLNGIPMQNSFGTVQVRTNFDKVGSQTHFGASRGQTNFGASRGQTNFSASRGHTNFGADREQTNFGASRGQTNFGASRGQTNFGASRGHTNFGAHREQTNFGASRGQTDFGASRGQTNFDASRGQTNFGASRGQSNFGASRGHTNFGADREQINFGASRGLTNFGASRGQTNFGGSRGQSNFGASRGQSNFGASRGHTNFGADREQTNFGASRGQTNFGADREQSNFGASRGQTNFGAIRDQTTFGAIGGQTHFGTTGGQTNFGAFRGRSNFGSVSSGLSTDTLTSNVPVNRTSGEGPGQFIESSGSAIRTAEPVLEDSQHVGFETFINSKPIFTSSNATNFESTSQFIEPSGSAIRAAEPVLEDSQHVGFETFINSKPIFTSSNATNFESTSQFIEPSGSAIRAAEPVLEDSQHVGFETFINSKPIFTSSNATNFESTSQFIEPSGSAVRAAEPVLEDSQHVGFETFINSKPIFTSSNATNFESTSQFIEPSGSAIRAAEPVIEDAQHVSLENSVNSNPLGISGNLEDISKKNVESHDNVERTHMNREVNDQTNQEGQSQRQASNKGSGSKNLGDNLDPSRDSESVASVDYSEYSALNPETTSSKIPPIQKALLKNIANKDKDILKAIQGDFHEPTQVSHSLTNRKLVKKLDDDIKSPLPQIRQNEESEQTNQDEEAPAPLCPHEDKFMWLRESSPPIDYSKHPALNPETYLSRVPPMTDQEFLRNIANKDRDILITNQFPEPPKIFPLFRHGRLIKKVKRPNPQLRQNVDNQGDQSTTQIPDEDDRFKKLGENFDQSQPPENSASLRNPEQLLSSPEQPMAPSEQPVAPPEQNRENLETTTQESPLKTDRKGRIFNTMSANKLMNDLKSNSGLSIFPEHEFTQQFTESQEESSQEGGYISEHASLENPITKNPVKLFTNFSENNDTSRSFQTEIKQNNPLSQDVTDELNEYLLRQPYLFHIPRQRDSYYNSEYYENSRDARNLPRIKRSVPTNDINIAEDRDGNSIEEVKDILEEMVERDKNLLAANYLTELILHNMSGKADAITERKIYKRALALSRLLTDPNLKVNVPNTVENMGIATKKLLEDENTPLYHVRNLLGSTKNTMMSLLRIPPQNLAIPSNYRIDKLQDDDIVSKALNPRDDYLGAVNPIFSRSEEPNEDQTSEDFGNSEEDALRIVDTFARLGAVMRESINSGKDTLKHIGDIAQDAKNVIHTTKNVTPRIMKHIHYRNPLLTRSRTEILTPHILDIQRSQNYPRNAIESRPDYLKLGNLLNAMGVSKSKPTDLNLEKLIVETADKPKPVLLASVSRFRQSSPRFTEDQGDNEDNMVGDTLYTLSHARKSTGSKSLQDLVKKMRQKLRNTTQNIEVQSRKHLKSHKLSKIEDSEQGNQLELKMNGLKDESQEEYTSNEPIGRYNFETNNEKADSQEVDDFINELLLTQEVENTPPKTVYITPLQKEIPPNPEASKKSFLGERNVDTQGRPPNITDASNSIMKEKENIPKKITNAIDKNFQDNLEDMLLNFLIIRPENINLERKKRSISSNELFPEDIDKIRQLRERSIFAKKEGINNIKNDECASKKDEKPLIRFLRDFKNLLVGIIQDSRRPDVYSIRKRSASSPLDPFLRSSEHVLTSQELEYEFSPLTLEDHISFITNLGNKPKYPEERAAESVISSSFFTDPDLLKPFMGRANEEDIQQHIDDIHSFHKGNGLRSTEDLERPQLDQYVLGAINPLMYEELFNQTLSIKAAENSRKPIRRHEESRESEYDDDRLRSMQVLDALRKPFMGMVNSESIKELMDTYNPPEADILDSNEGTMTNEEGFN